MNKMTDIEKLELKMAKKEYKDLSINIMQKVSFKLRELYTGEELKGMEIINKEYERANNFLKVFTGNLKIKLEKHITKDMMTEKYFSIRSIYTQEQMEEMGMIEEYRPYIQNL